MAKHQQPLPRPTAPLTPMQQTLKPQAPLEVRTWMALGIVDYGKHAAALLRTQGTKVVECHLLDSPRREAVEAEEAWLDAAYPALFHGEKVRTVQGPPLMDGIALGLHRIGAKFGVVVADVDGGRLSETEKVHFLGSKLDAWHELDAYAAHNILTHWVRERRRKQA